MSMFKQTSIWRGCDRKHSMRENNRAVQFRKDRHFKLCNPANSRTPTRTNAFDLNRNRIETCPWTRRKKPLARTQNIRVCHPAIVVPWATSAIVQHVWNCEERWNHSSSPNKPHCKHESATNLPHNVLERITEEFFKVHPHQPRRQAWAAWQSVSLQQMLGHNDFNNDSKPSTGAGPKHLFGCPAQALNEVMSASGSHSSLPRQGLCPHCF